MAERDKFMGERLADFKARRSSNPLSVRMAAENARVSTNVRTAVKHVPRSPVMAAIENVLRMDRHFSERRHKRDVDRAAKAGLRAYYDGIIDHDERRRREILDETEFQHAMREALKGNIVETTQSRLMARIKDRIDKDFRAVLEGHRTRAMAKLGEPKKRGFWRTRHRYGKVIREYVRLR